MSVFNTANQIYRTAQATSTAQLQAAPVQYSQQPGTNVGMPSSSMPNAVQQPGTISPVGQPTQPFNQSLPSLPDLPTVPSQY
jgi:hypothetical protein